MSKTIKIKHRISKFYVDKDTGSTVFAMYEDMDGHIHYKHINADAEPEILPANVFEKEFNLEEQS